ncbi:MAG TPA: VCBS repeat-containing protein [Blastocatellia bacterium]|nr:VCBS repeat-containing protein [Blastocatellia bacterium]
MGKSKRARRLLFKSILTAIALSHCGCKELLVKMPKELEKTGVEIGNGLFDKKVFLSDRGIGGVTDLYIRNKKAGDTLEIVVAGRNGVRFVDRQASIKSKIAFDKSGTHVDVIDLGEGRPFEYLSRGGEGWQDSSLIDHSGKTLWTYGGDPGVDDMAAGDLDGDGKPEFVVGFNGDGGVHLVNHEGKKQWAISGSNEWSVEIADTDGDGAKEIIKIGSASVMTWGKDGKLMRQSKLELLNITGIFSLCYWPDDADQKSILTTSFYPDNAICIFGFDGKLLAKLDAPKCEAYPAARLWGTPVKLRDNEPEYFAVIADFGLLDRASLYVFNPERKLVYQEILPERCQSIAAVSLADPTKESILVGGYGKILRYDLLR